MKKIQEILSFYPSGPHMVYHIPYDVWSWVIRHNRHIFCHFGSFFVLLPPWQPEKSKFWKNEKMDILSLYTGVPKMTIIWCMVLEKWSAMDRIFLHFGPFFSLFPSDNMENQYFEKVKKGLEILSFYKCVP